MRSSLRPAIIMIAVFQIYLASQHGRSDGPVGCSIPKATDIQGVSETRWVCLNTSELLSLILDCPQLTWAAWQNVLLIGAGVSSTDIAREITTEAKEIYQVSRGGAFDLPTNFLPPGAIRIQGEIHAFDNLPTGNSQHLDALKPIPGRVVLKDGRELTDIHRIIICTGYHMSLPFLPQYHNDNTPVHEANSTVLVTHLHRHSLLHRHLHTL